MKLIAGLGNPGRSYTGNRHNIGFMCLNHFAGNHGIKFDKKQGRARTGTGQVAGNTVILARPQTYMNSSGESVKLLVKRFNISPDNLVVIHDDLDLALGKIRLSYGAGSGGHKGVDSIIACLQSQEFIRLRLGIGHPAASNTPEADVIAYVLSDFTPAEKEVIDQVIPRASEALLYLLTEGLTAAMNKYNSFL